MVASNSGAAQTNIEHVEIFNGDQLLGSVPLVAGQWTYSPSGLSVGSYSLTARCRGVESVTWQLRVDQPGVIDDFEDLEVEYYGLQRLIRPLFIAQFYTVTGSLLLSFRSDYYYGLNPPDMALAVESYRDSMDSSVMAGDFVFTNIYAVVSLKCVVAGTPATGSVATVRALDEHGIEVDHKDLLEFEEDAVVDVKLGGKGGSTIKSLEFYLDSGVRQSGASEIIIRLLSVAMS
jgi:hypothetical protein